MAATKFSLIERAQGTTFTNAYANSVQSLDLIQIIDQGGSTLLNVTAAGVVHNPASGATNGTHAGVYKSSRTSGTTAQLFAATFTNPQQYDVLQVISVGGAIAKYIDYLGVSH